MPKVKVYYNSACPVCNAGIRDRSGVWRVSGAGRVDRHSQGRRGRL